MRISCYNCYQVWKIPTGAMRAAKLRFRLGTPVQTFLCPHCQTENVITQQEYSTSDVQIPVPGKSAQVEDKRLNHPARADNDPASAPTNPISSPAPHNSELHAIVLDKELQLRRNHHPKAEVMGSLRTGEHILILDTWEDGKDIWIQLGPERWSTIEENGKPLIQLLGND